MIRTTMAATALLLLLAGCNEGAQDAGDGRAAEGEVLGGTIGDDMLPLDTVQSQSPPLRTAPEGEDGGASEPSDADEAAVEGPAEDVAEEPAAEEPAAAAPEESEDDGE